MIGSLISGALSIGSTIYGSIAARKARKEAENRTRREMESNQSWYRRRYNEDSTQRADAQRILAKTAESIRERNNAARGRQAVAGGTDESVASTKAANASAMAEAASRIAAAGDARKDNIEREARRAHMNYTSQLNGYNEQNASDISQAATQVGGALGKLAGEFDSDLDNLLGKKSKGKLINPAGEDEKS